MSAIYSLLLNENTVLASSFVVSSSYLLLTSGICLYLPRFWLVQCQLGACKEFIINIFFIIIIFILFISIFFLLFLLLVFKEG